MATFKSVSISTLCVGVVLGSPIHDSEGNKLFGAGVEVTAKMVERLQERGVNVVVVDERDLAGQNGGPAPGASIGRQPVRKSQRNQLRLQPSRPPFAEDIQQHRTTAYNTDTVKRLTKEHKRRLANFMPFVSSLAAEQSVDTDTSLSVSNQSLFQLAEDIDLFTCLATNRTSGTYPGGHSFRVAMLAMSIGTTMGLDEATLVELSTGCLLHDIGMMKLDKGIYERPRMLKSSEFVEIAKHPSITLDLLRQRDHEIPETSLMVVRQTHERCNGSGYPDGRSAMDIHDLAKIAAVADTFTAMVTPRAHRDAVLPHYVAKTMLGEAKNGLYDFGVVHALLDVVSGYPIGSFVELSDHRIAKVIRATPGNWVSPIVQVWNDSGPDRDPVVLNLANEPKLTILRPIAECFALEPIRLDIYG